MYRARHRGSAATSDYLEERGRVASWVQSAIDKRGLFSSLRGSWTRGDFHLALDRRSTFSDVDLVVESADEVTCQRIASECARDLEERLPMRVSVHGKDSLALMTLADSCYLSVGEYIARSRAVGWAGRCHDYQRAKLVLKLLRRAARETNEEIVKRLDDPDAWRAWGVKLGTEVDYGGECAERILGRYGTELAKECILECIHSPASSAWTEWILERVKQAPTIEPWLRDYLVKKVSTA